MRRRSRSFQLFTTSAAVAARSGSARMSSGPAERKLKPRSSSASWIDETPRSRRTPSNGARPCSRATTSQSAKLARTSGARSPKRARTRRASASASGSTSSPRRRPDGAVRSRIASACPPAPTVPSRKRPPSRGSSWASTSARRTGSCSLPSRCTSRAPASSRSDPEVREISGDLALDPREVGPPASRLPDLEVVGVPDDDGFGLETGEFAEVGREREPPLGVRVRFMRAREQEVAEARRGGIGARPPADVRVEDFPLRGREDRQAFPYPTRHDRPFLEAAAELGRNGEAPLFVEGMGELAGEEAFHLPFSSSGKVPHRSPLLTTPWAFCTTWAACQ